MKLFSGGITVCERNDSETLFHIPTPQSLKSSRLCTQKKNHSIKGGNSILKLNDIIAYCRIIVYFSKKLTGGKK